MNRLSGILAVVVLMSFPSFVFAGTIATESFDYTVGSLAGQNGGTGWQGPWSAVADRQTITSGANLTYTFQEGATISGGDKALKLYGTGDVGNLMSRRLGSTINDDQVYLSFLLKRAAGSGTSLDFAMLWVDDDAAAGPHSDYPNIGLFEPFGTDTHHVVARTSYGATQADWAAAGGASATDKTMFVVARLSKGNVAQYQEDYDRIDLWAFDSTAPGSVLDFRNPHSSTGGIGSGKTFFDFLGARITSLETDDVILYDELRLGTQLTDVVPAIVGIPLSEAVDARVLDFDDVPVGLFNGTDPLLHQYGIEAIWATSTAANPTDIQNQTGQTGRALFFNGTELMVLPQANAQDPLFPNNSHPFINDPVFTVDLLLKHRQFGLSLQDQVELDFTLTFFLGDEEMGGITQHSGLVVNTPFIFETPFYFDRVVIQGSDLADGWGIDNILLDVAVPEPSTVLLLSLGGVGLTLLAQRRRVREILWE